MKRSFLIIINIILAFGIFLNIPKQKPIIYEEPIVISEPNLPKLPNITTKIPNHLSYKGIVEQLKKWNTEAPDLTEVGIYGKTSKNQDIYYFKIKAKNEKKKTVMITAAIHGNEPHSAATLMAYIGNILGSKELFNIIEERDLYFIPVVSPDSYPRSRHVDGVDPNRDFPTPSNPNKISVPPIKAIQEFYKKIKPNAVISMHTWGRVFLIPYGDKNDLCPDNKEYQEIIGETAKLCNYRIIRACQMYSQPIYGTEVDWYYRNGSFAVVMEIGVHQNIPTLKEIEEEFNRTFKGILYFIQKAPLVQLKYKQKN
jgi:hypothetical protein